MKYITFTGFSTGGLDAAVRDAHNDLERWQKDHYTAITERAPVVTATMKTDSDTEYWFTITLTYVEG